MIGKCTCGDLVQFLVLAPHWFELASAIWVMSHLVYSILGLVLIIRTSSIFNSNLEVMKLGNSKHQSQATV